MYAAGGAKLNTVQQWSGGSKQTDYCGDMIYENGTLKRILTDGGYIEGGAYYFYVKDHEGNNRVVADANGTAVQSTHYYPFGMSYAEGNATSNQPYRYNGKELDTERGLNWYDYGARFYDPAIARWTSVDPMAEMDYSVSPYQRDLAPYALDPRTLNKNLIGSYPGPWNPKSYSGKDDYSYKPSNPAEIPAYIHDKAYDKIVIKGGGGLLTDPRAISADCNFVQQELLISQISPNIKTRMQALVLAYGLSILATPKIIIYLSSG